MTTAYSANATTMQATDAKTRSGRGSVAAISAFPVVLGYDFSGVVVESPYASHPLQPGTEVYTAREFAPDLLEADGELTSRLDAAKLDEIFDYTIYTRHVDENFRRLGLA